MPPETFGQRLQRLRAQAGLSQSQVAQAAQVPIGSLRNWEHDRRVPLVDAAHRLAKALGVSLDMLVGEEARTKPAPARKPKAHGKAR